MVTSQDDPHGLICTARAVGRPSGPLDRAVGRSGLRASMIATSASAEVGDQEGVGAPRGPSASSSSTRAVCGSAWSWALRRIRSTWASARLQLGDQVLGHRHQPGAAGQADERDVEGQVAGVELLVGRRRRGPRRCTPRGLRAPRPAARGRRRPARAPRLPRGPAGRGTRRAPCGVRAGHAHAAVRLAGGQALGHEQGQGLADGGARDTERAASATSRSGVPDSTSPSKTARRSTWATRSTVEECSR